MYYINILQKILVKILIFFLENQEIGQKKISLSCYLCVLFTRADIMSAVFSRESVIIFFQNLPNDVSIKTYRLGIMIAGSNKI